MWLVLRFMYKVMEVMERVFVKSSDGYSLDLHVFEVKDAKAAIQIVHGMEEHQERYEPFIRFLNESGYSVVSSDLRGHGASAPSLGFFKKTKGYERLLDDQRHITRFIGNRYVGKPIIIFAHSFGTVITRVLLQTDSENYSRVILSGYPNFQWAAHLGVGVANMIIALRGPHYKSSFLQRLSIGAFNRQIKNPDTDVDWVAHDRETVRAYIADPLCGFGFSSSAFRDLYHLVIMMHDAKRYHDVNREMPILMMRGEDDPCVGGDKGAADSRDVLERAGFNDIRQICYSGMRHEILNETDHRKVYADVLAFLLQ